MPAICESVVTGTVGAAMWQVASVSQCNLAGTLSYVKIARFADSGESRGIGGEELAHEKWEASDSM
jgi:hypothetical protein